MRDFVRKVALFAILALTAFLAGFMPMKKLSNELAAQLAQLQQQVDFLKLQNKLVELFLEVEQKNFGAARPISTAFFNEARRLADSASDAEHRRRLEQILSRRDEITADLASTNPATADKLKAMYAALRAENPGPISWMQRQY